MKTWKQQRGMIDVEGFENLGKSKEQMPSSKPQARDATQDRDLEGKYQEFKKSSKRAIGRLGLALAAAGAALLLLWVAYMFRYEVIPVANPGSGYSVTVIQYIVKDRWTGEIEAVWQQPDGKTRRSSRQAFE